MQNKKSNYIKGRRTESIACKFLKSLNWKILERNVRIFSAEIDIIAKTPDHIIVFVEVKSNWDKYHGFPSLRVNFKKQTQIWSAAHNWLMQKGLQNTYARFDIIAILWKKGKFDLKHYENAFIGPRSYF